MVNYQTSNTSQKSPYKRYKIDPTIEIVREFLGKSFLDVGCGQGLIYKELKPLNYTGIDYYQSQIDIAKKLGESARWVVGDIFDLKTIFKDEEFDCVLCSRLLIHLPFFHKAMDNLLQVTRKVCVIVVQISDEDIAQWHDIPAEHYFRSFSVKTLSSVDASVDIRYKPYPEYSTVIYKK